MEGHRFGTPYQLLNQADFYCCFLAKVQRSGEGVPKRTKHRNRTVLSKEFGDLYIFLRISEIGILADMNISILTDI